MSPGGTFQYRRREDALTGLTYSIWTSTSLAPESWTRNEALQSEGTTNLDGVENLEVQLAGDIAGEPQLFVQIRAQ